MIAEVSVIPNSKRFALAVREGRLRVALKSAPERNKANIELVRELSKVLGRQVRIASGLSSKKKRIEVGMTAEEWGAFLSGLQPDF